MRLVFTTDMVFHLFANRAQESARNSSDNVYFRNNTLYSYGEHFAIAHFLPDGSLLWNDDTYSNTTARHKSKAWQALAGWQRKDVYHVPSLSENSVRDLPRLIASCDDRAASLMHEAVKFRKFDKVLANLAQAKGYERTAAKIAETIKRKYTPKLPDTFADKAEFLAFVGVLRKKQFIADYQQHVAAASQCLEKAARYFNGDKSEIGTWYASSETSKLAARDSLNDAARHAKKANDSYKLAHGKASAKANAIIRKTETLKPAYDEAAQAEARRHATYRLRALVAEMYETHARNKRLQNSRSSYRRFNLPRLVADAREQIEKIGNAAGFESAVDRFERISLWDEAWNMLESARSTAELLEDYDGTVKAAIAKRQAADVLQTANNLLSGAAVAFLRLHGEEIAHMHSLATMRYAEARAALERENAAIIADWIAGRSNVRPSRDAGTFARIKGETVETSLGATVPLEHACRLARIARVVIRKGGETWQRGAGPIVGHFRVDSISASGAAVIGCHEFSAEESNRMLALLETVCTAEVESC